MNTNSVFKLSQGTTLKYSEDLHDNPFQKLMSVMTAGSAAKILEIAA